MNQPSDTGNKKIHFSVGPLQRWLLLLFAVILGYIIAAVVSMVVIGRGATGARVCIVTVIQDIFVFIMPALITAMFICRRPAEFLSVYRRPSITAALLVVAAILASIPFMNAVIEWNANVSFPESIAESMRSMENSASELINAMVNGQSVVSLIVLILVVGCFAGFAEELFFRGTVQRLLITGNVNPHLAVWLTAIVFSAFHLQFYGFVPRLLLGAMFGYFAWWFGSIWPSVIAHIFNNCLAAFFMWLKDRDSASDMLSLENVGHDNLLMAGVSLCLLIGIMWVVRSYSRYRKVSALKD